jgi:SAM-dependent methyltransferase
MPTMPNISQFEVHQLEELFSCPWCDASPIDPMFTENGFPYVQCRSCKLIYLQKRVREEYLGMVYTDEYHVETSVKWFWRTAEKRLALLGALPKHARIHEDGAGSGAFVAVCRDRGFHSTGNDLGSGSIQSARSHFGVQLTRGAVEAVGLGESSVDVFASFNLLSHVYRPWEYLKRVSQLLAPGGRLLLRTGDRSGRFRNLNWGHWSAPEHVFHYNTSILREMMTAAQLKVERIIPAFDSDYPYFLYDYSHGSQPSRLRKTAGLACGLSILTWNTLRLKKDDVFVLARRGPEPIAG